jgi:hypothetical protein
LTIVSATNSAMTTQDSVMIDVPKPTRSWRRYLEGGCSELSIKLERTDERHPTLDHHQALEDRTQALI